MVRPFVTPKTKRDPIAVTGDLDFVKIRSPYALELVDCPVVLLTRTYDTRWPDEWRCLVTMSDGEMRVMSLRTGDE